MEKKGIAIAYARLEKLTIPPYVLTDVIKLEDVKIGQLFDLKKNQERYVKIQLAKSGGWHCTNVVTGQHVVLPNDSEVQLPFKW